MTRLAQQSPKLEAARDGRSIRRWIYEGNVTDSYVVSTDDDIYYDIPEGKQIVVTRVFIGCESIDEYVGGYIVACSAIAGGGDATPQQLPIHDHVGDKKEGSGHITKNCNPPIVIKYSDGFRSVSMAVKATDADTVVTYGWNGWHEDESTLS